MLFRSGLLVPGNMAPWEDVRDELNSMLLGWSHYFSYGAMRGRTSMSIGTSINGRATSSRDGTRCKGAERCGSPATSSMENWASSVSNACPDQERPP